MLAERMAKHDQCMPLYEIVGEALYDEMAEGYRSPIITLPFPQWDRVRRQMRAVVFGDFFYLTSAQGTHRVYPEIP